MSLCFAKPSTKSLPLHILSPKGLKTWLKSQPEHVANWLDAAK